MLSPTFRPLKSLNRRILRNHSIDDGQQDLLHEPIRDAEIRRRWRPKPIQALRDGYPILPR